MGEKPRPCRSRRLTRGRAGPRAAAVPCAAAQACKERHTDGTGRTRATAAVSGRRQVVNPGVHGPRPGVQSTSSMSSTPPLTDRGGRRPDQVQASHRRNGSLAPAGTAGRASNQTHRLGWTRSVRDGEDPSVAVSVGTSSPVRLSPRPTASRRPSRLQLCTARRCVAWIELASLLDHHPARS